MRIPTKQKKRYVYSAILVVVVIIIAAILLIRPRGTSEIPTYDTVLPRGATVEALGGWKRVSPPGSEPVFAYLDTIDGVSISVSQQPLPTDFEKKDDAVGELARSYNATHALAVGDMTIYIGTSAKGPQSVIFSKKDLLILIKSQATIADTKWLSYISTLE